MSVIIYQEYIEILEEENEELKRQVRFLKEHLVYKNKGSQPLTQSVSQHKNS